MRSVRKSLQEFVDAGGVESIKKTGTELLHALRLLDMLRDEQEKLRMLLQQQDLHIEKMYPIVRSSVQEKIEACLLSEDTLPTFPPIDLHDSHVPGGTVI